LNYYVKENIIKTIENIGGAYITKMLTANIPRILLYHRFTTDADSNFVSQAVFDMQINFLRKNFTIVSLWELSDQLKNQKKIKPNTVVITVDDGYEDFYKYAFPVLRKYSVPAIIYVTSDFIEKKTWLWPDKIDYILKKSSFNVVSINFQGNDNKYQLTHETSRKKAWNDLADYCLTLSNKNKNEFIQELSSELGVDVPKIAPESYSPLTWDQIREMSRNDIDIGSHTCTHPKLTMVETKSELLNEIINSKIKIEAALDKKVYSFSYPNGTKNDIDKNIKKLVKMAGYDNAVAGYFDIDVTADHFEIKRHALGNNFRHFYNVLNGIEYLKHRYLNLKN
jgi:peptidoglycan/xylan/chitin deacetylase (PgdA/CDA1 family)